MRTLAVVIFCALVFHSASALATKISMGSGDSFTPCSRAKVGEVCLKDLASVCKTNKSAKSKLKRKLTQEEMDDLKDDIRRP